MIVLPKSTTSCEKRRNYNWNETGLLRNLNKNSYIELYGYSNTPIKYNLAVLKHKGRHLQLGYSLVGLVSMLGMI